ncbi:hypothetical protein [Notoacmeibacter ruber]|uniref:Uncharacterized protein n=1 Tax=Notoacmeibacter ruber TaxID=2670375 RepID=A0A3L7JBS0_9HYPH|nr:hypothetical protein [Notoacmeibacter ruber]RLQ88083.1 hypothetical protein D8780_07555 [Notoacmeibacter ruber]
MGIEGRFLDRFHRLPNGYCLGRYQGRRWGVTKKAAKDERRFWLYAEELGGSDFVSLNLYRGSQGRFYLRPCEMAEAKVRRFVLGFHPEPHRIS